MRKFLFLLVPLMLSACKKEPGSGGLAQVRGVVMRQDINNGTGQPEGAPYAYPEFNVYIEYGDHDYYDDHTNTNPSGLYTFSWLRTGKYTVFVYSECPTCPSGKTVMSQTVNISGRSDVVTVPTFTVANW